MAVDPLIVVGMAILIVVILVINVYILVYYTHPEDRNESYLAKVLVVCGLQLSAMSVLMLPIGNICLSFGLDSNCLTGFFLLNDILLIRFVSDIANNAGNPACDRNAPRTNTYCGGIQFIQVWESLFCMVAFVVVALIPFAIFYYGLEEYDIFDDTSTSKRRDKKCAQFSTAMCYELFVVAIFFGTLIALYFTADQTHIPVNQISASFDSLPTIRYLTTPGTSPYSFISQELSALELSLMRNSSVTVSKVSYTLNFAIYATALFGWIGFWIFSFFAGAGLTALPMDLICAFVWRPKTLSADELHTTESEIQDRTNELIEVSTLLKRERTIFNRTAPSGNEKRKRLVTDRIDVNRLTQMIFILERDVEEFQACKQVGGSYNPLIPVGKLLAGIVFGFITLLWLVHIIVYMLVTPAASIFLNAYFFWFNSWFPIFGNVSYALFSLYLLFCTISGCFKFGLRLLCCKIYPVKVGQTYMDSFLFNIALILSCTIPVVHFCTLAFASYAVDSDVFLIFGVQIAYLNFYTTFYSRRVFPYIILLTSIVTFVYLLRKPRDSAYSTEDFKATLLRRGASGYVAGDIKACFVKETKDDGTSQLVRKEEKVETIIEIKDKKERKQPKKWVKKARAKESTTI